MSAGNIPSDLAKAFILTTIELESFIADEHFVNHAAP